MSGRSRQFFISSTYPIYVANRFPNSNCVLCINPSEGVGEHVWSSWLLKDFQEQGPFSTLKNGSPLTKRDGVTPQTTVALPGIHVPMCSTCNNRLNSLIEVPAKGPIRRLIPWVEPHNWPNFDSQERLDAARWFLKVALLMAHPEAVHDNPKVQVSPGAAAYFEDSCLDWMRNEDLPPEDFSVYVTRRPVSGEVSPPDNKMELEIPSVVVDGVDLHYMFRTFGMRGLDVAVVWHPGWDLRHPLVEEGRAIQMWPGSAAVNFSGMPVVHPDEFRFVDAHITSIHFTKEMFKNVTKSPLSIETDIASLVGFTEFKLKGKRSRI